jgi:hypothetical protein
MTEIDTLETDDIYLAAYFMVSGCVMEKRRKIGTKVLFTYSNPAGPMKDLREAYYSGKGLVKAQNFSQAIVSVKQLLFLTLHVHCLALLSSYRHMGRSLPTAAIVRDQIDIFNPPSSFTRAAGIIPSDMSFKLFVNNSLVAWGIVDGSAVPDSSISSGRIYFNQILGAAGFYSIRFYPDRVGFWRLVFTPALTSVEIIKEFDISPSTLVGSGGGLNATFTKP